MKPKEATLVGAWKALCEAAAAAGAPLPAGGDPRWLVPSGHSGRRSGAKLLARCGWALWMIQWFGRWAGDAVKGYVEEVWIHRLILMVALMLIHVIMD